MTLGIKTITGENWLKPDPTSTIFAQISASDESVSSISGDDWVKLFLGPSLAVSVPNEVRKLFEVARGALVYGYFFYPLYTLGGEQLLRVVECAASVKCDSLGAPTKVNRFKD